MLINMCVEVAELGNKALASHSIPELPATEASGSRQQKEKAYKRTSYEAASRPKVWSAHLKSSTTPIRFSSVHAHIVNKMADEQPLQQDEITSPLSVLAASSSSR